MGLRRTTTLSGTVLLAGLVALGPLAHSASAAPTEVARWRMEDTGRTMRDSSGFGHHGTSPNVTVPQTQRLDPGTSSFSVSARFRFSALPSGGKVNTFEIVRKGLSTTSGGNWKLEMTRSGVAHCLFSGSAGLGEVCGRRALNDGRSHTATCSRTSSTVTLTVDATSRSTSRRTGTIDNDSSVRLGAKDSGGSDQYRGHLDTVSISKG